MSSNSKRTPIKEREMVYEANIWGVCNLSDMEWAGKPKNRLFLKPLITKSPLLITFAGERELITLSINDDGIMVQKTPSEGEKSHLVFFGNQHEIIGLLQGDIPLQQLVQSGKVKVKGSFRALLRLEAILWLTDGFFTAAKKQTKLS